MQKTEIHNGLGGIIAGATAISRVVPEKSRLSYRGYDVNELAEHLPFTAVAWLIWHGEVPSANEHQEFCDREASERELPPGLLEAFENFPDDAHPMDVMRTGISFFGMMDQEKGSLERESLQRAAEVMFAKAPTLLAAFRRKRRGEVIIPPDPTKNYIDNFFHMCGLPEPDDATKRCFDISMTLYAEHGFNASTFVGRSVLSSLADSYGAVTAAIASLKGPLHGGANEAVQKMIEEIREPEHAREWIETALKEKRKVMGFGHRIYRLGDSRVPMMTCALKDLATALGKGAASIAILEILEDVMVGQKGIYPNLDFPAGPSYHLMGFETDLFTPLFVMSRITGWTAHLMEQAEANRLVRPSAAYVGSEHRTLSPNHGFAKV